MDSLPIDWQLCKASALDHVRRFPHLTLCQNEFCFGNSLLMLVAYGCHQRRSTAIAWATLYLQVLVVADAQAAASGALLRRWMPRAQMPRLTPLPRPPLRRLLPLPTAAQQPARLTAQGLNRHRLRPRRGVQWEARQAPRAMSMRVSGRRRQMPQGRPLHLHCHRRRKHKKRGNSKPSPGLAERMRMRRSRCQAVCCGTTQRRTRQ